MRLQTTLSHSPERPPDASSDNSNARFGISFGILGALEEAIKVTREYSLERCVGRWLFPASPATWSMRLIEAGDRLNRKQFGKPLAGFQLVQKKLADAHQEAASECSLLG